MSGQKKNSILIVDDETLNIITLTSILGPVYNVFASSDGQNAVELAKKHVPDIILLDILMPKMDGYEVITALKNSEITQSIPVIYITGLDDDVAEEKGLTLGAVDYITRPFSSTIVKLRIQNQIKIINHTHELDERLKQQALMTKIAHNFLTDAYIDSLFTDTLRMVGEFMDIAQVLLFRFEDDKRTLICLSEWIKPEQGLDTWVGGKLQLEDSMISLIANLLASRKKDLCFHSNDPSFREIIKPYRKIFQNCITVPIFIKGEIHAVLDFSRKDDGREWSESEISLAVLISSIFSGVFERDTMERQFSIVEHTPNLVLYITPDGAVEYVNPAVTTVTGYTKSELIAGGPGIIFGKKVLTEIMENHIPDAMRGKAVLFEVDITRKDGKKRILMISIFMAGKNNLGMVSSDLTVIRELEAGLIAAKNIAEHSSRVKGEFLSRMSHEMLTPLNVIMGMMQIIKMQKPSGDIKESFDEIEIASRQLLRITDDVLDLSSMEYGAFKLSDSVFDFGAMVQSVSKETGYNASEKRQLLGFNIDPAIPVSLSGDEKRLKQVITTLLANAVKFTPELGKISFEARMLSKDNGIITLQVEVTDNGIGISKEQQSMLYNIFEQLDGGNTRKYGGIGIGLALSKRIIEMMGGSIWIESELDKGAKFCFTCKLREVK